MPNVTMLKTRIFNKYDTLANWQAATEFYPREGEICIAEMGSQNITQADGTQTFQPVIAIKVGIWNGTDTRETENSTCKNFNELPWIQAIAGDVYAWAKAATPPSADQIPNLDSYISGKVQDTDTQYQIVKVENEYHLQSKTLGGSWADVTGSTINVPIDSLTAGTTNGTVNWNGTEIAITGLKSAAYEEASAFEVAGAAAAVLGSSADDATANTVYGAKAAAAKAQSDIDAFLITTNTDNGVLDTLKEIQDFLDTDDGTVGALLKDVEANKQAIANYQNGTSAVQKAEVASGLDSTGITQVQGIKVNNAANAEQLNGVAAANYALKTDIEALDSSVASTEEVNNRVSVLTGISQENGKLVEKTEVQLSAIAKTGRANDLIQEEEDCLIFDCGSATRLIYNIEIATLGRGSLNNIVLG